MAAATLLRKSTTSANTYPAVLEVEITGHLGLGHGIYDRPTDEEQLKENYSSAPHIHLHGRFGSWFKWLQTQLRIHRCVDTEDSPTFHTVEVLLYPALLLMVGDAVS